MSKSNIKAFITFSMEQAVQKTARERLEYIPAGVKDGVLYNHKGSTFGELDIPDTEWIPKEEMEKSRIADSRFKVYKEKMLEAFSNVVDEPPTEVEDSKKALEDGVDEPSDKDKDEDDAEVVEDIKEALEDGDIEDAYDLLTELKNPSIIEEMKKLINSYDDKVGDEDLMKEFKEIIKECGSKFEDDDIADLESIIDEMVDQDLIEEAEGLLDDILKVPEPLTVLTEEEAIEKLDELIQNDGSLADAKKYLEFIKTPRHVRYYTRKIKRL